MKPKILSFGEIIWDIYDSQSLIGGAALNFAAHCQRCGAESYLFSAAGNDEYGEKARCCLKKFGINDCYVKISDKATGACIVTLDSHGTPRFNVMDDAAFDNINVTDNDIRTVTEHCFDALYFGTLIQRSPVSRDSLKRLCSECRSSFKEIVCDINLRKNCYDADSAAFCLENATVLKLSLEEEPLLRNMGLYKPRSESYEDIAHSICTEYSNIKYVILTLGEKGSFVYCSDDKTHLYKEAEKNAVVSTVGAGDSYIAAWITSYLSGASVTESTELAAKLSSFVVSKADAIPGYILNGKTIEQYTK